MAAFDDGYRSYRNEVHVEYESLFEQLAEGQHPTTMMIACSDSRIVPNLFTQMDPGELFMIRNAGNIVPRYDSNDGSEAAVIEYAVRLLNIPDIIVCGHSRCGTMHALLHSDKLENVPMVRRWINHAHAACPSAHADQDDPEVWAQTAQRNVLVQLDNMRTHPCVREAVEAGRLTLHGWYYIFESGTVLAYSKEQEAFVPID